MTNYLPTPVIDKFKKFPRWLIGLMAAGVIIGPATFILYHRGGSKVDVTQLTVPVESKNITLRITASGKVQPILSVNISPKNPGILEKLYVEQGDRVTQGQIIARMDSADVQAQIRQNSGNVSQAQAQFDQARAGNRPQEIAQAKARLAQSQAQLAAAKAGNRSQDIAQAQAQVDSAKAQVVLTSSRVTRYRNLAGQGAISQNDLDQYTSEDSKARAALDEAQRRLSLQQSGSRSEEIAQREAVVSESQSALQLLEKGTRSEEVRARQGAVTTAQGQLQAQQVKLEDTIIRAPFSGIVTQKYATIGAFVTPTTSASSSASATSSSIVALARGLEVLANVPEVDISKIKSGQLLEIVADAYPDRVFKGHVRLISPEAVIDQNVTSFQVRVAIDTGEDLLRSGLNVNLTFLGDAIKDTLVVPTVAIITEKGQTGVLLPDANSKPQFRPVTIGTSIKDQTQILTGVKIGDRVFVNPPKEYTIQKQQEQQKK